MIICLNSIAQSKKALGKIVYEQIADKYVQYIEMWFSTDTYMYIRKDRPEDYFIKGKTYLNIEDSLADVKRNEMMKLAFSELRPQKWIGSLGSSVVYNSININNSRYTLADTMKFAVWEIKPDTLTINGLLCQLAETTNPKGAKVTAWFAPSIPVSVAPYSLRGLPGLLVEVNNKSGNTSIRMLELEWPIKKEIFFDVPDISNIVTKTEFDKALQKQNKEAQELVDYYKKQ
ncbi:MAG TPA: GLPGLI family protein [Chitinophagaceae bacterium]|jgi:GLPGLI family protein|nr:GLPGLI family protein [Chitinophagaceae bacterium]